MAAFPGEECGGRTAESEDRQTGSQEKADFGLGWEQGRELSPRNKKAWYPRRLRKMETARA